ncbi:multiprotein-bridging factor 1 family protein [Streptomyces sp. NPDC049813]|uniref:multiprotein-bridging factor 1 family protein n=1 Tax=Streptomyces sp. NPDC049813 TaxID=3365597 RepID=UPI0037BB3E30
MLRRDGSIAPSTRQRAETETRGSAFGFASLLQDYRAAEGLTQKELADLSATSVRAIRDLEHGRAERPRRDTVRLLADALRLDGQRRHTFERVARRSRPSPTEHGTGYEYATVLLASLSPESGDGRWAEALTDMGRQRWHLVGVDRGVAFLERSLGH